MIVSGGVDDTAYVWNLQTGDVKFECRGHSESVAHAGFNANSAQVATADLGGYVQVHDTTTGNQIVYFEINEVRWMMWHDTSSYVLLAGTVSGEFWMWHTHDQKTQKCFRAFDVGTSCGKLVDDGANILVAYDDGSLRLFDLKTESILLHLPKEKHESPEVICMDYCSQSKMIALGYANSKVKIVAKNSFKLLKILACNTPHSEKVKIIQRQVEQAKELEIAKTMDPPEGEPSTSQVLDNTVPTEDQCSSLVDSEPLEIIDEYTTPVEDTTKTEENDDNSTDEEIEQTAISEPTFDPNDLSEAVETIRFSPSGEYLLAANTCGSTYIWQVSNQGERAHVHLDAGVCRAAWVNRSTCVVGCLDGSIRIFDPNLRCIEIIHPHKEQILDICYKQGLVVSASDDKRLAVFQYQAF